MSEKYQVRKTYSSIISSNASICFSPKRKKISISKNRLQKYQANIFLLTLNYFQVLKRDKSLSGKHQIFLILFRKFQTHYLKKFEFKAKICLSPSESGHSGFISTLRTSNLFLKSPFGKINRMKTTLKSSFTKMKHLLKCLTSKSNKKMKLLLMIPTQLFLLLKV